MMIMKKLILLLLLISTTFVVSQETITIGTSTSSSASRGPFQRSDTGSSSVFSRAVLHYTADELSTMSSSTITEIKFDLGSTNIITATGDATLVIYMKNSSATEVVGSGTSWVDAISGATQVGSYTFNTTNNFPGVKGLMSFPLSSNFNYTGGALEIAVDWDCSNLVPLDAATPNQLFSGNGSLNWRWEATSHVSLNVKAGSSGAPSTFSTPKSERANIQIVYTSSTTPATSGQVLGEFSIQDGGMEDQTADDTMPSAGTSQLGTPQTTWTVSSTSNSETRDMTSDESLARSGVFSAALQLKVTKTNVRLQSPSTSGSNLLLPDTEYTVQFHYKSSEDLGNDLDPGIYLNNTSGGKTTNKTDVSAFVADTWIKSYGTVTTGSTFNASHWGVVKISGESTDTSHPIVRFDDFVIYAGSYDGTPPSNPTFGTYVNSSGTATISWSPPLNGDVDGGGYVVIKYSSEPNADNDPNQNGIYEHGNTITNGTGSLTGTVTYIGTETSFTDTYTAGNYYKIYTVDKAFNYSNEITVSDATNNWVGITDRDWGTASNWSKNSVPTLSDDVTIHSTTSNQPIIGATTGASVNNLTVDSGASLSVTSGGSIIVGGTSSGDFTYNRNLSSTNWYLVSSPVVGQTYNDAYITANEIASGSLNNRGIATYVTLNDSWDYMQEGESLTFTIGSGYSVKRSTVGDISFTGSLNTDDDGVDVALTNTGNRFNLLGNPYASHIASATFLANETAISETSTLWVWDQSTSAYQVKTIADAMIIAPAQGFFVKANSAGGTFNFTESNQLSNGGTFQRTQTKPEINLSITDQSIQREARIYYIEDMTTGFDVGYEGELFNGVSNPFAIYTQLITDNQGRNYQVQSLPTEKYEEMIIPVGINAVSGKVITISASTNNFPSDIKIYLEDKLDNSFTLLGADSKFSTTLENNLNGIGRFYLHTSANTLSSNDTLINNNLSIFTTSENNLRIVGVQEGEANISIYNLLGQKVLNYSFKGNGVNNIKLPFELNGIYIVKITSENGTNNKKIIIQ